MDTDQKQTLVRGPGGVMAAGTLEKSTTEEKKPKIGQPQLLFFGKGTDDGTGKAIEPPSPDEIRAFLDRSNPECPFSNYIGNDAAIQQLFDVLFAAHLKPTHNAGPGAVALIGPPSTGKTTLARYMAKALGTTLLGKKKYRHALFPIAECDRNIKSTSDLLVKLKETLSQCGVPLTRLGGNGVEQFKAPPCVVYFDEAQAIKGDWLLKCCENKDAMLITSDAVVDCRNVLWIISTTHRGRLPKAFDSRFDKVFLYPYTLEQVATMVQG